MRWIIRAYSLILLVYTAWRTVDFLLSQLPKSDLSLWLSLAFLFASEAGLILWHEISLNHSTTREQHGLAVALTWVDFVASLAAGTADMILRQTLLEGYTIPTFLAQALIYGLPLVMAGNIAGVLLWFSNDAETQIQRAKSELRYETFRLAIKDLRESKTHVAESMKAAIARELRDSVTQRMTKEYLREPRPSKPSQEPTFSGNGGGENIYNAEASANPTLRGRKDRSK